MTGCGRAPSFTDDSTLPEEERAMLDRARAIVPRLADRAPAAVAARRLPPETIAEYHAAGILRILQPRRVGGPPSAVSPFSPIVRGGASCCAAPALVSSVLGEAQRVIRPRPG